MTVANNPAAQLDWLDDPGQERRLSMLSYAKACVVRGWKIFPLVPGQKNPATSHGFKDATNDLEQINRWWSENTNYNIGIACGQSNLTVLDFDSETAYSQYISQASLPETFTVKTARGIHKYYSGTVASGNLLVPGQVKSTGGYVVAPGSIHPNGPTYTVIDKRPVAEAPNLILREPPRSDPNATPLDGSSLTPDFDIQEFLKHYGLAYRVSHQKNGTTHYYVDSCVMAGKKHSGDKNKSAFILGQTLGYRCFSDDCDRYTIGAVLRKLNETHEPYPKLIWKDDNDSARYLRPAQNEAEEMTPEQLELFPNFKTSRVQGGDHDYVLGPKPGYKEGMFPRGEVSLLVASSGGGKSTLLYDILEKQLHGEHVFGRETYKRPYLLVLHDRSDRSVRLTFARLGLDPARVDHHVLNAKEARQPVGRVVGKLLDGRKPLPEIVVIEGLDMYVRNQKEMDDAVEQLSELLEVAQHFHIAVIGTVGTPKLKVGESFSNDRDAAFGSVAWSRKSETIWTLKPHKDDKLKVTLSMLPRHSPKEEIVLEWIDGKLVEMSEDRLAADREKREANAFLMWVLNQDTFTKNEARKHSTMNGKRLNRRLEGLCAGAVIKKRFNKGQEYYEVLQGSEGAPVKLEGDQDQLFDHAQL